MTLKTFKQIIELRIFRCLITTCWREFNRRFGETFVETDFVDVHRCVGLVAGRADLVAAVLPSFNPQAGLQCRSNEIGVQIFSVIRQFAESVKLDSTERGNIGDFESFFILEFFSLGDFFNVGEIFVSRCPLWNVVLKNKWSEIF